MDARPKPDLLSGRTLFRTGIVLVILAVTFLFRYSIDQGWIGPLARVGLAAGSGALMIGIGLFVGERRRAYGNLLQGGGSAVLYLSAFAAHRVYDLIGTTEALIQMAVVATVAVALALRARSESLAGIGLLGAAIAPILVGGRLEVPGGDTVYFTFVGVTAAVLLLRMRWLIPYVISTAVIAGAVTLDVVWDLAGNLLGQTAPAPAPIDIIVSIALTWALLVGVPLFTAAMVTDDSRIGIGLPAVTTAIGSPLAYAALHVAFSDSLGRIGWSLVAAAGAVLHAAAGHALERRGRALVARVQLIPAVILGLLAMFSGLSGEWILVGLAAISAGAVVGGLRSGLRYLTDAGHAGMAIVLIATSITVAVVEDGHRTVTDLIPGAAVLLIAAIAAVVLWIEHETETFEMEKVYASAVYVGTIGWIMVEFPRLGEAGLASVTGGWTLLGLAAVVMGRVLRSRPLLGVGFTTLGVAMAKLFIVDLAEAPPIARISLFAGIGVALLAVGYWLGDDTSSMSDEDDDTDDREQQIGVPESIG